jgi:hypothetical protein
VGDQGQRACSQGAASPHGTGQQFRDRGQRNPRIKASADLPGNAGYDKSAEHSIERSLHLRASHISLNVCPRGPPKARHIRIGKTPVWSIETARDKAKYFRSIVDQGGDPASGRDKVQHVENIIQHIAEHLQK